MFIQPKYLLNSQMVIDGAKYSLRGGREYLVAKCNIAEGNGFRRKLGFAPEM